MVDIDNENNDFLIRDTRKYAVVTDPVAPQAIVASQWPARGTRVSQVKAHEIALDSSGNRSIEFADLFVDCWREAKPIGHGLGRIPVKVVDSQGLLARVTEGLQRVLSEVIVLSIHEKFMKRLGGVKRFGAARLQCQSLKTLR